MGLGKLVSQEIEIRWTISLSAHTHTHTHCCCCCLVAQSCLTLCDPKDCSLPVFSVHGIFQKEYWSRLPFPSPKDLPNPGSNPCLQHWQASSSTLNYQGSHIYIYIHTHTYSYIYTYIFIYIWTMWICYLFKNINNCWQVATLKYSHVSLSYDTSTGYKIWIHR